MKLDNKLNFSHDEADSLGILVTNLGTPDSHQARDVRRYLGEFLWDPRVVEVPRPLWWMMLNLVILTTRPRRSAAAYAKIWTAEGSPLLVISEQEAQALQLQLDRQFDTPVKVGSLVVRPGDLLHGDEQGVTVIPKEVPLDELVQRVKEFLASERTIIDYCAKPGFEIEQLCKVFEEHDKRVGGH